MTFDMTLKDFSFLLVLLIFCCAAFSGVMNLGFVWDDKAFLVNDVSIRSAESLLSLFFEPFFISDDYYRPLVVFSYALQARMHGLDPQWFHLFNLFIHLCNSALLFLIIKKVFKIKAGNKTSSVIAFVSALVFSLHPAAIETVAWVSGRFDLFLCFFILLFIFVFVYCSESRLKYITLYLCFLLAALSKESAVGFALALPCFLYLYGDAKGERLTVTTMLLRYKYVFLMVFFAGLTYLLLRYVSIGYILSGGVYNDYGNLFQRVLLSAKAFWVYIGIVFFPFLHISPIHYHDIPVPTNDIGALFSLVLTILFTISFFFMRRNILAISVLFLLLMIPALHILQTPLQDNLVQERYLYLPLAILLIYTGIIFYHLPNLSSLFKKTLGSILITYIALCFLTIKVTIPLWVDDLSLWSWASLTSPESKPAKANLAAAYENLGYLSQAETHAKSALITKGRNVHDASIYITLANIYNKQQKYNAAAEFYLKSLEISRNKLEALVNMANTLIHLKEYDGAKWYLELAESYNSKEPLIYINYGMLYARTGESDLAEIQFNKGLMMMEKKQRAKYKIISDEFLSTQE